MRKDDPGHPEGGAVFAFHGVYSQAEQAGLEADCKAGRGLRNRCRLKERCQRLAPIQERRAKVSPALCQDVLEEGNRKAALAAEATMQEVRQAMNLS